MFKPRPVFFFVCLFFFGFPPPGVGGGGGGGILTDLEHMNLASHSLYTGRSPFT